MRRILIGCLFVICVLIQSCSRIEQRDSSARIVTVEGHALFKDGMQQLAKQLALQDAIRQAAMQSSISIQSQTLVNQNSVAVDAVTLRSDARVRKSKVLKEWTAGNIYHLIAMVELSDENVCIPHQRKRIIATAFPVVKPEQVSIYESQDMPSGIPRELINVLTETDDFFGINISNINLYQRPDLAPEIQDKLPNRASKIIQQAAANGAQLVLSGVIRDLEVESSEYMRGSGPISYIKSIARDFFAQRGVGIEVFVHDGFTGQLLLQHRYIDHVVGDVWIPSTYAVGSERFNQTSTGEKINQLISQAAGDIHQQLACYPFTTRIIDIKNNEIVIEAGSQDRVAIGNQFIVYNASGDELVLESGNQFVGKKRSPVDVVTITSVATRYAVGVLEKPASELGIRVGDWVRSE